VYAIGVWVEADGALVPRELLTATVTLSVEPYGYLLRSASDQPASEIDDPLVKKGKMRLDYLLSTHPGIEKAENPLDLQVRVNRLDGAPIEFSLSIPVENDREQLLRLLLTSLSWLFPFLFTVWVFYEESARHNDRVLQELTAIQITPATELLPLVDRLLKRRREHWLAPPIWLNSLNDLSEAVDPTYLFHEVGGLASDESATYRTALHNVIEFLRLEHQRHGREGRAEQWLARWQIESSKIPPHCSLRKLANWEQIGHTALTATISGINQGRYSELLAPVLADVLRRIFAPSRQPSAPEMQIYVQMFAEWKPVERRRVAIRLPPAVIAQFEALSAHTSPRYPPDDVLSTLELPILPSFAREDGATRTWLRGAGFRMNPFSPYLDSVQNLAAGIPPESYPPAWVIDAQDESECFAIALSSFVHAYSRSVFPVWCIKEPGAQTETLSELTLNSLAAGWIKFLTLYPEEIFSFVEDRSNDSRLKSSLQLAELLGLFYRTPQGVRAALNVAFQKIYAKASKSEPVRTQLHLTLESLWANLLKQQSMPSVFNHTKLRQWYSLRPRGTSKSLIMLIDLYGSVKRDDKQLADLVNLLEDSSVSIALFTYGGFSRDALPGDVPIETPRWDNAELERILRDRLSVSSLPPPPGAELDNFVSDLPIETDYHRRLCAAAGGSLGKLLQLGNQIMQRHVEDEPDSRGLDPERIEKVLTGTET